MKMVMVRFVLLSEYERYFFIHSMTYYFYLESLDKCLILIIPNVDVSIVKRNQHPWFRRMQIYTLDTIRSCRQLSLHFQFQRLGYKDHTNDYEYTYL